jgi:general stress protein CsbA
MTAVRALVVLVVLLAASACKREKTYTTTVEVLHVQSVSLSPSASALVDV